VAVDSTEASLGSLELMVDATVTEDESSGIEDGGRESGSRAAVCVKGYEAPVYLTEYMFGGYRAKKLRRRCGTGAARATAVVMVVKHQSTDKTGTGANI
jgi:hypothetical protein